MAKPFQLDPDDRELFRREVESVKPLRHDRAELAHRGAPPIPRFTRADERQVLADMTSDHFDPADLETGEEIFYCRAGLQHSVLRKLRRGHYRTDAVLDLHGMTVPVARVALTDFLHQARRTGLSCLRIIHGKGNGSRHRGPILKRKVNHWLRQRDDILAFCSARSFDGGTGAIYLLLRGR